MALKDISNFALFEDSAPAVSDQQIFDWFLANQNADDKTIASTMDQFKLTPEDIARATGTNVADVSARYEAVKPAATNGALTQAISDVAQTSANTGALNQVVNNAGNVLSGNILAGASWNSTNNTLADQLTATTGLPTINTAVGGATTADTLQQLNDFTAAGGSFAPGSTVFLQTGGVDMLQGVDDNTIKSNIDQIVSTLENQGVKVVLTASPRAGSLADVVSNNFETGPASFYSDIAANHSNVAIVDTMGQILQDKSLLRDALHTNAAGEQIYNASVIAAYERLNPAQKIEVANKVQASGASAPTDVAKAIDDVAGTDVATTAAQAATTTASTTATAANKLKDQILAQGTTAKWTGEGFGSAEANAADMAKILAGIGITDLNQFGQITKTIPAHEEFVGDESGGSYVTVPEQTITTYGNKVTGQEVPNTYSERQTGNAFGGTFAGKGNTGYRVQFDASGAPIFYTTGASSNDLVNLFADDPILGKVATAAAAYFGGPAGVAALQAAMGKSVEDIAKGALLTYAGGELAQGVSGATVDTLGATGANIAGKAAGQFVSSGGKADIGNLIVSGGIDAGTNAVVGNIDGFSDLSAGEQNFVKNVVKTTIQNGGNLSVDNLVDAALNAATTATKAAKTDTISTAIAADKTVNDAVTAEIDKQTTIDASGAMDLNAAAAFAADSGYNKFTFDGKKYTLDNNNAENTIKQLEADALKANTETNLAGSDFAGLDQAITDAAKRNTVVIGNAEADTIDEAAALAKQRDPSASQFTYGGQTYSMTASQAMMDAAFKEAEAGTTKPATTTGTQTKTNTALANYVSNKLSQNLSSPDFNPADLTKDEMAKFVSTYANATDAQKAQLLKGADKATFSVIDTLLKQTVKLNPSLAGDQPVPAGATDLKAWDKSAISTAVDVAKAAGNVAAADVAGLGVRGAQFLGDLMGQDTDGFAKVQNLLVNDKDKSMSKLVGNEKVVAGGIASGVESAVAWTLGGPMAGVATIAGVVANNSWVEGANAGLSPVDNAKRTAAITAIEVAGEMLGIPGMKAIMKGIPVTGSVSQIVNGLTKAGGGLLSENASELLTTVAQFGVDKFASFGLSKDASFEDFQNALKDTIIATTAAVGTSSGISTATRAASGANTTQIADADRTAVSPDTSVLTSGAAFGAKAGDTSNQGLNPVTSEAIDFNKLDNSSQTSILDNLRSQIANVGLTAALTLGSVGSIANATEVESYVSTSIQQAASTGANVQNAINSSVSSSISSAINNKVNTETAINSAVSSAVSSAVANNVNTSTAINTAVTSAVNTAATSNVSTTAAVSSAVNSAVSTAINTSVANNTMTTSTVNTAVNTAVNSAVQAAVANNVSTTSAVNTAVTAAVEAAVSNNVSVADAVQAAVNAVTNLNVNVATVTALANSVANDTVDKKKTIDAINTLIGGPTTIVEPSGPTTQPPVPPVVPPVVPPTTPTSSTPSSRTSYTPSAMAGMIAAGEIGRLPPQMLKAYMTQDKFIDPLAQLHALQEEMNAEKMPPIPQVNTQESNMPDQGTWKYGSPPDDFESLFSEEEAPAFKAGGYVAPLQMASGGAMALPLLAKSGGALGALPRPDGRLDFRHGAHVAGEGDGQSDDIKAMLADGEFVFPADVVSALGNGSTKAGSDKLYEMMHSIRERARSKGPKDLPPPALKSPLDYLKKKR